MKEYDLIIFDCDGTLVDSEYLNNAVTADVLTAYGLDGYTTDYCIENFSGRSWTEIKQIIDAKEQIDLPRQVIEDYIQSVQNRMSDELKIVDGAKEFVDKVQHDFKICVGSNGERSNVLKSLQITGLDEFFPEELVFTKIQVARAKPAPDLFLFAADNMDVVPSRCLVIEDSVSGAKAGVAAGMDVVGFTGVSHNKPEAESALAKVGAQVVFDCFIHIATHLGY